MDVFMRNIEKRQFHKEPESIVYQNYSVIFLFFVLIRIRFESIWELTPTKNCEKKTASKDRQKENPNRRKCIVLLISSDFGKAGKKKQGQKYHTHTLSEQKQYGTEVK